MCGIVGWINYEHNLLKNRKIIETMTDTLSKRGPDDRGFYISENALMGHRRLVVVDPAGGTQPMTKVTPKGTYTIVYNGELYNTEDLRGELLSAGYSFKSYSDTEVLLTSFIEWGYECVKKLNGIFAFGIWHEESKTLFLARDPLGVKPLFYTQKDDSFIFGSEIKAILANPIVEPVIDEKGLLEIFGLGPARSLGSGVFKGINEVPPANSLIINKNYHYLEEYWKLQPNEHREGVEETAAHVRELFVDAVKRQLVADVPICTFLSGGLDSSAISAIASSEFKKQGKTLTTYSIDYSENEKYFKKSLFQPDADSQWVGKVAEFIGSNHKNIILDNEQLAYALFDSVKASDLPGMADIDSSLFLFCKEIRKENVVALSGENAIL